MTRVDVGHHGAGRPQIPRCPRTAPRTLLSVAGRVSHRRRSRAGGSPPYLPIGDRAGNTKRQRGQHRAGGLDPVPEEHRAVTPRRTGPSGRGTAVQVDLGRPHGRLGHEESRESLSRMNWATTGMTPTVARKQTLSFWSRAPKATPTLPQIRSTTTPGATLPSRTTSTWSPRMRSATESTRFSRHPEDGCVRRPRCVQLGVGATIH